MRGLVHRSLGEGGCGCTGLGNASIPAAGLIGGNYVSRRFPTVEKVLGHYIADCLKSGKPFWISDQLNSDALEHMKPHADAIRAAVGDLPQGFGQLEFIPAIISAIAGAAGSIGSAALAAAPAIASIAGTAAQVNAANAANQALAQQRIAIPQAVAPQVISGVQNDIGGIPTNTILLFGAGALLFIVAMKK